MELDENMIIFA